jgi:hypothetical protein
MLVCYGFVKRNSVKVNRKNSNRPKSHKILTRQFQNKYNYLNLHLAENGTDPKK